MFGKYIIRAIMIVMILTVWANAQTTAQSYLEPGREALFNGTLSGIRTAAQLFEEGLNDPDCFGVPNKPRIIILSWDFKNCDVGSSRQWTTS